MEGEMRENTVHFYFHLQFVQYRTKWVELEKELRANVQCLHLGYNFGEHHFEEFMAFYILYTLLWIKGKGPFVF